MAQPPAAFIVLYKDAAEARHGIGAQQVLPFAEGQSLAPSCRQESPLDPGLGGFRRAWVAFESPCNNRCNPEEPTVGVFVALGAKTWLG